MILFLLFFDLYCNLAVFSAIERKDVDEVDKVLQLHGHLVSETRGFGKRTALHHAAHYGDRQICETLLRFGADVNKRDARQQQPLWIAASKGNTNICQLFIDRGADTYFLPEHELLLPFSIEIRNLLYLRKDSYGRKFCFLDSFIFRLCLIFIVYFFLIKNAVQTCSIIINAKCFPTRKNFRQLRHFLIKDNLPNMRQWT